MNLNAVYPNPDDLNEEFCFEELRAKHRGWMERDWSKVKTISAGDVQSVKKQGRDTVSLDVGSAGKADGVSHDAPTLAVVKNTEPTNEEEGSREDAGDRTKKLRVKEVKGETQTSKITSRL